MQSEAAPRDDAPLVPRRARSEAPPRPQRALSMRLRQAVPAVRERALSTGRVLAALADPASLAATLVDRIQPTTTDARRDGSPSHEARADAHIERALTPAQRLRHAGRRVVNSLRLAHASPRAAAAAEEEPEEDDHEHERFLGRDVTLVGLQQAGFNGQRGRAVGWDRQKQRVIVETTGLMVGKRVFVKSINLRLDGEHEPVGGALSTAAWAAEASKLRRRALALAVVDGVASAAIKMASRYPGEVVLLRAAGSLEARRRDAAAAASTAAAASAAERHKSHKLVADWHEAAGKSRGCMGEGIPTDRAACNRIQHEWWAAHAAATRCDDDRQYHEAAAAASAAAARAADASSAALAAHPTFGSASVAWRAALLSPLSLYRRATPLVAAAVLEALAASVPAVVDAFVGAATPTPRPLLRLAASLAAAVPQLSLESRWARSLLPARVHDPGAPPPPPVSRFSLGVCGAPLWVVASRAWRGTAAWGGIGGWSYLQRLLAPGHPLRENRTLLHSLRATPLVALVALPLLSQGRWLPPFPDFSLTAASSSFAAARPPSSPPPSSPLRAPPSSKLPTAPRAAASRPSSSACRPPPTRGGCASPTSARKRRASPSSTWRCCNARPPTPRTLR